MAGCRAGCVHRERAPDRQQGQHRDHLSRHQPGRSRSRTGAPARAEAEPLGDREPAALGPRRVDGRGSVPFPRRRPRARSDPEPRAIPHSLHGLVRARGARELPRGSSRSRCSRHRTDSLNGPVIDCSFAAMSCEGIAVLEPAVFIRKHILSWRGSWRTRPAGTGRAAGRWRSTGRRRCARRPCAARRRRAATRRPTARSRPRAAPP